MNLSLLQAFQAAVNEYGSGDGNMRVGMASRGEEECFFKVVKLPAPSGESNLYVRMAFKSALTSAFGVASLECLPPEVKAVLKIKDFRLSKNGEVRSSRPLTVRRIKAVMAAVKKVAMTAGQDSGEVRQIEDSFTTNFNDEEVVKRALARVSVVSGRKPLRFSFPGGMTVDVPLASLKEYTKDIMQEDMTARIDDIHDQIQQDVYEGCAIYANLIEGRCCIRSNKNIQALRCYLSFMAIASGKGGRSRVISVPDPDGQVAKFLKADKREDVKHLRPNDAISGSAGRTLFVSGLECLGKAVAPMRQMKVEGMYRRLASNPMASKLLQRKAEQGGFTIAQMWVNVKAELARVCTVGEDELRIAVRKERGGFDAATEEGLADIGKTKAFEELYSYRYSLSEFLFHLEHERTDLDLLEMRIGDEIVLSYRELVRFANGQDNNQVLSPRNVRGQREEMPQGVYADAVPPNGPGSATWRNDLIKDCGSGNFGKGLSAIVRCMRTGCLPESRALPPEYDFRGFTGTDVPQELKPYFDAVDNKLLSDLAWYVKSSAAAADDIAIDLRYDGPRRNIPRPLWSAFTNGLIDRSIPVAICKELINLFRTDDTSRTFAQRTESRPLREGEVRRPNADTAAKAATATWGFGTYDMTRILKFVKDCGYYIEDISAADLGKLTAIAALNDFKLEDAPMFLQRQTGKSLTEITTKDLESLFRLKCEHRLNDKGATLSGDLGEIAAVLKGDKLPSMTGATGRDILRLLAALRTLASASPDGGVVTEFLGRKVAFRVTLAGALVFNVGGFEFRAAKTAREFIELVEDDAVGHVDKFGFKVAYSMLPQIRGAATPADPVAKSRVRELCLRYLKGCAGIDPAVLSCVSTDEIFKIAEGVADERYTLHTGKISKSAIQAMLERKVDSNLMTGRDAAELCDSIKGMSQVPEVELKPIVLNPPSREGMDPKVKLAHDFMADIVFDSNPFDFDRSMRGDLDMRVVGVMKRHVRAMAAIAKNPALLATFPDAIVGNISGALGFVSNILSMTEIADVPEESLAEIFEFMLDNMHKTPQEREAATDRYLARPSAASPAPAPQSRYSSFMGVVAGLFSRKPTQPPPASVVQALPAPIKKRALLGAMENMAAAVAGSNMKIENEVSSAMDVVQDMLSSEMGGAANLAASDRPIWSMEFEEIVGGAMTDADSGYGKFMHTVLKTYFSLASIHDQRKMFASVIRHVDDRSTVGEMAGALFKGAGPLLQKMLQGLPPSSLGPDLALALEDMKSNLLPIPNEYVIASMKRIVDRSNGRIRSITVERSLGAASVGQAFLCKMVTVDNPAGEECVVKLLRPTVKAAIMREREIFENAAAHVPGMSKTFEGQLSRILEELDFTLEATNINFGRNVYEQPVYLRQTNLLFGNDIATLNLSSLHSMEVHPLVTPTMDCLVLKKAPGDTYDRYMKKTDYRIHELLDGLQLNGGNYALPDHATMYRYRKELFTLYNETLKRQRFLIDLTKKWVHEGLFGNGFYHGDLHAGNIMTDGQGLTVIDFGNATHLNPVERGHVLRMISAALVGWNDMFESSFKALLSEKGRADYNDANANGELSRELAEVLNKGSGKDVGMRIAATLMLLQKHGIEVPGPIYNFNQCQMRLGGTVDAMNSLLQRIRTEVSRLSVPPLTYTAPRDGNFVSAQMFSAMAGLADVLSSYYGRGFDVEALQGVVDAQDWLQSLLAEFNSSMNKPDGMHRRFLEELEDEEFCQNCVYPFIEQLQTMRFLDPETGVVMENRGSGVELKREFESYRQKREHAFDDRKKLVKKIYEVVKSFNELVYGIIDGRLDGAPESFLVAVGDSISDSVYTVRTTLGNVTSIKLMKEQEADAMRVMQSKERMRDSDQRVAEYLATLRGARLSEDAVLTIKKVTGRLSLPFDLPGLDGGKGWLKDAESRRRIYEAIDIVVGLVLPELERLGVFGDDVTSSIRKEAVCVMVQYLVDRVGGLFEALGGLDNRTRQNIMLELREFLAVTLPGNADSVNLRTLADLDVKRECTMAAVLHLLNGGERPMPEGGGE